MTQSPTGGPAATVYQVSSRQGVVGRDAQRVVIVTDGRAAEGGPQQAAYFVTDAEIAAGEFIVTGNKPLPIVLVGQAGAEHPPVAYYDVTGKADDYQPPQGDQPAPTDPIGDALRAATAGYWTLNEVAAPWANSVTGPVLFLSGSTPAISSVTGAVGNGLGYTDHSGQNNSLQAADPIGTFTQWSISCWVKISQTPDNGFYADLIDGPNFVVLSVNGGGIILYWQPNATQTDPYIVDTQWHHVAVVSNGTSQKIYVDTVLAATLTVTETPTPFTPVNWLLTGGNDNTDTYALDEVGIFNNTITANDIAYLYNSGAGRALFPAP